MSPNCLLSLIFSPILSKRDDIILVYIVFKKHLAVCEYMHTFEYVLYVCDEKLREKMRMREKKNCLFNIYLLQVELVNIESEESKHTNK